MELNKIKKILRKYLLSKREKMLLEEYKKGRILQVGNAVDNIKFLKNKR